VSNLAEDLAALGLTRNEALAYVCLLQAEEPLGLTGYEVAARSGIPRSAVYGILRRLQEGEFAFPTGDKPARYAPLPPREVVARVRSQTLERIEDLAGRLEELPARNQPEPIWILDRYERLLQVVSERLAAA
jgi:sugar-specific transcriptional regulator TrmB